MDMQIIINASIGMLVGLIFYKCAKKAFFLLILEKALNNPDVINAFIEGLTRKKTTIENKDPK